MTLPTPKELSLNDAVDYIAAREDCSKEEAGRGLRLALCEGVLFAHTHKRPEPIRMPVDAEGRILRTYWKQYPLEIFLRDIVPAPFIIVGSIMMSFAADVGKYDPFVLTEELNSWLGATTFSTSVVPLKPQNETVGKIEPKPPEEEKIAFCKSWIEASIQKGKGKVGRNNFRKPFKERFGLGQKEADCIYEKTNKLLGRGRGQGSAK